MCVSIFGHNDYNMFILDPVGGNFAPENKFLILSQPESKYYFNTNPSVQQLGGKTLTVIIFRLE